MGFQHPEDRREKVETHRQPPMFQRLKLKSRLRNISTGKNVDWKHRIVPTRNYQFHPQAHRQPYLPQSRKTREGDLSPLRQIQL